MAPEVEFLVVNVSCPNVDWTKKLGAAGSGKKMQSFIDIIEWTFNSNSSQTPPVVLLKIGPDWKESSELQFYVDLAEKLKKKHKRQVISGFVVSNTTWERDESTLWNEKDDEKVLETFRQKGGLSGQLLKEKANKTCKEFYTLLLKNKLEKSYLIVGVGGLQTAEDCLERIKNGATFLELYTAMVFKGPGLISTIKSDLTELLKKHNYENVSDAVGANCK